MRYLAELISHFHLCFVKLSKLAGSWLMPLLIAIAASVTAQVSLSEEESVVFERFRQKAKQCRLEEGRLVAKLLSKRQLNTNMLTQLLGKPNEISDYFLGYQLTQGCNDLHPKDEGLELLVLVSTNVSSNVLVMLGKGADTNEPTNQILWRGVLDDSNGISLTPGSRAELDKMPLIIRGRD